MATPLLYEQELIDAIPVPLYFLDLDMEFVGSNEAFTRFIGKSDEEVGRLGIYALLSMGDGDSHEDIDRVLIEKGAVEPFEAEVLAAAGRRHSVIFRKSLVHDAFGTVTGIVTTIVDLTDLKAIEEALVASESQKKAILDGFPGIIALFDRNLAAIWVNDTVRRNVARPIGRLCDEIICQKKDNCTACAVPQSALSGQVKIGIRRIEATEDGGEKYYEVIGTPVKNTGGTVESVIVIARDITERFKLEKQLRHAQKMEAIGTLAGGIAHDFNNVLTPIIGYSEIIRLKLRQEGFEDDAIMEYLGEILKASKRAKGLVEQILAFSRSTEQRESLQHVHPIVKEVLKLMRLTLPSTIQIDSEIDEKCGPVSIDPVQIHQVLINLCTNSSDAIGDNHGKLIVKLKKAEPLAEDECGWIELSVEDTGCGMNRDLRERIFEPYFTTKEKGRGTGMGLALVHSIVTRHGGRIDVVSEENVGTTFRVFLPAAAKATTLDKVVSPEELVGGEGHVMLVDDESQVVQVTSELLQSLGYRVSGWTEPAEALKQFRRTPDEYDLLLTDLTMPRLTGIELSTEIKKIRPALPVILFTGYSERLTKDSAGEAGIDEYCMKPISLRELSRMVSRLIRRADGFLN